MSIRHSRNRSAYIAQRRIMMNILNLPDWVVTDVHETEDDYYVDGVHPLVRQTVKVVSLEGETTKHVSISKSAPVY